jgi:hypothetical protein
MGCLFSAPLKAQENNDWINSDIATYRQYINMEWDSLIELGNQNINAGVDYYYLRVRMGIAYYNKQRYVRAKKHFTKALEYNPTDQVTLEYLYYSNLFFGNDYEAKIIGNQLNTARKEELGIKNRVIEGMSADFTYSSTPEKSIPPLISQSAAGIQQIPRYFTNTAVTLKHMPWKRFKLMESYTFMYKNSLYSSKENGSSNQLYTNHILQNQFYISGVYYPAKGLQLSGAWHSIFVSLPNTTVTGNGQGRQQQVTTYSTFSDYTYSIGALQSFGYLDFGYTYTGAELNNFKQNQHTLNVGIYPFGNLNLYALSRVIFLDDKTKPNSPAIIFGETIGIKLGRNIWVEGHLLAGEIRNMSDYGSYIVYNDVNTLKLKTGVNVLFPFKSGLTISLRSNFHRSESTFTDPTIMNKIYYTSTSITGGLSWNF